MGRHSAYLFYSATALKPRAFCRGNNVSVINQGKQAASVLLSRKSAVGAQSVNHGSRGSLLKI